MGDLTVPGFSDTSDQKNSEFVVPLDANRARESLLIIYDAHVEDLLVTVIYFGVDREIKKE